MGGLRDAHHFTTENCLANALPAIKQQLMSHYYTQGGNPCHTQPTKKGAKNPDRPTDVRDARRLNLFPSITGITAMLANDGLTRYKQMMIAEEAFKRPPIGGEDLQEYTNFLIDKASAPAKEAAELGSKIHELLEAYGKGDPVDLTATLTFPSTSRKVSVSDVIEPVVARVAALGITALGHEVVAVNAEDGYAGTLDMPWTTTECLGLMDYKTTKTKPDEPVIPRLTHAMQLAAGLRAYRAGVVFGTATRAQNIFISTTEPGRVDVIEYNGQELAEAWEAFKACLVLWRVVNKHDPRKGAA